LCQYTYFVGIEAVTRIFKKRNKKKGQMSQGAKKSYFEMSFLQWDIWACDGTIVAGFLTFQGQSKSPCSYESI